MRNFISIHIFNRLLTEHAFRFASYEEDYKRNVASIRERLAAVKACSDAGAPGSGPGGVGEGMLLGPIFFSPQTGVCKNDVVAPRTAVGEKNNKRVVSSIAFSACAFQCCEEDGRARVV